jgi:peptide/nickel transport system substrate-binding protein
VPLRFHFPYWLLKRGEMATDEGLPQLGFGDPLTRRSMITRSGITLAMLSPTLAALAGCGDDDDGGGGGGSGGSIEEITWILPTAPPSLDLAQHFNGTNGMPAQYLMAETLVSFAPDLELVPILAESIDTPDPSTFVYTLRKGVRFHDGSPMTVEDVIFSIEHAGAKDSQVSYYFTNLKSVEQTGEREVTLKVKEPTLTFRYAPIYAPIIPKAFADAKGKKLGKPNGLNYVGTGPYKLERFDERALVVVRNDKYWGDAPPVESVSFSYVEDPQTQALSLRSGEVDGMYDISPPDADQFEKMPDVELLSAPGLIVWFLAFNVQAEPWSDIHVRRAFAHAYNQQGVIQAALGGHARPATAMVPDNEWAGLLSDSEVEELYASLPAYPYDLEKAKAELAQSSVPDGFKAKVQAPDGSDYVVDALLALAADLKKIGVELEVTSVPQQKWLDDAYSHENLGITCHAWGPDYPDASNYLDISYSSGQAVADGYNFAQYKNPEVDRLIEEQSVELDTAKRAELLSELLRVSQEDLPYLSLWWEDETAVVNRAYRLNDFSAFSPHSTQWAADITRA